MWVVKFNGCVCEWVKECLRVCLCVYVCTSVSERLCVCACVRLFQSRPLELVVTAWDENDKKKFRGCVVVFYSLYLSSLFIFFVPTGFFFSFFLGFWICVCPIFILNGFYLFLFGGLFFFFLLSSSILSILEEFAIRCTAAFINVYKCYAIKGNWKVGRCVHELKKFPSIPHLPSPAWHIK